MRSAISAVLVALLFILTSCTAESAEGIFDYQKSLSKVEGTLSRGGETYGVILSFEKDEGGTNNLTSIELTSPETLSGFIFERTAEGIRISTGKVSLLKGSFETKKIFEAEKMFTLSAEDIVSIKTDEDGNTVTTGENGSYKWKVHTAKDGLPARITVSDGNGESTLEIKSIKSNKNK